MQPFKQLLYLVSHVVWPLFHVSLIQFACHHGRSESFSDLQPTPKAEEVRGSKMEEMPSNCIVGDWQEVAGHL